MYEIKWYGLGVQPCALCGTEHDAFPLLEMTNHPEQIVGSRIALVRKHPHETFRALVELVRQGLKADRRIDVVAQGASHFFW